MHQAQAVEVPSTEIYADVYSEDEEAVAVSQSSSFLTEDISEDEHENSDSSMVEPVDNEQTPIPVELSEQATSTMDRPRRTIQLPARFKPYWMFKP